jgi:hypothetical protein
MDKIKEILTIKGGMASYVDISIELFDPDSCSTRMANYHPIKSHRDAFEIISRTLDPKDRRCYLITGSYGTGKSHLCLMLANYFMHQSDVPELQEFFKSYSTEDKNQAKILEQKRKNGRYLVAVPNFGNESSNFEELVLRAIDQALKRENFQGDMDSHYYEAKKKIEDWAKQGQLSRVNFYKLFCEELKEKFPAWTTNKLLEGLSEYNAEALTIFRQIHKSITSSDFTYDKDSLVDIITQINSTKAFQEKFKGIVIIFDELGYFLDKGRIGLGSFHAFSHLCTNGNKNWKGNQLIFIGTAHKSFASYAKTTTAVDLSTLSDRINEIALQTEGMEDIISAIVIPQKNHPLWKKYVGSKESESLFNKFSAECKRLHIFDWLPAPRLREKIIENLYPMHPMATYCLLSLAKEIASANRSVFTFFSGEFGKEEGSYPWFIESNDITNESGYLSLYTTDLLFSYFKNSLVSSNKEIRETARKCIENYETTLKELNKYINQKRQDKLFEEKEELMDRILKVMLIHEISGVDNNKENLEFSLNVITNEQKKQLAIYLELLTKTKVLWYNNINSVYEFNRSDSVDIDSMIDAFKATPENYPRDIIGNLEKFAPMKGDGVYLEAKNYNQTHNEDKRLLRRFCLPNDLSSNKTVAGKEVSFFEFLETEMKNESDHRKSYEGIALYVICEDTNSINTANNAIVKNPSTRIAIAIPKEPVPIAETIFNCLAIENIKTSETYESFSTQDKTIIHEKETGYNKLLLKARDTYFSPEFVQWHGKNGKSFQVDKKAEYDIANKLITPIYYKNANKIQHDEFNKIHIKFDKKNAALKEAVEKFLDRYSSEIIINTEYAHNRGEIRYIKNCFLTPGAFREVDKKGPNLFCLPERVLSKFKNDFPSLVDMIEEIQNLEPGKKIKICDFIEKYAWDYGQGPVALCLMVAYIRCYFGDNIRIKHDETSVNDMKLDEFDELYDLITGQYPNAYIEHRDISDSEHKFVNRLYEMFSSQKLGANANASVIEVNRFLKDWWENLPSIAKVKEIYEKEDSDIYNLFNSFEKIGSVSEHNFVLEEIQTIYGFEPKELITDDKTEEIIKQLKKGKDKIESAESKIQEKILRGVCEVFNIEGSSLQDMQRGITKWFDTLDTYQRDINSDYHTKESKSLIKHLSHDISDINKMFFENIPNEVGFNLEEVRNWLADKTSEYIKKIKEAKNIIEKNQIRVENAKITFSGKYKEEANKIRYKDKITVRLEHSQPGVKIYITTDDSDPKTTYSNRQLVPSPFEMEIRNNPTLKFVSQDKDGNFSRVAVYDLINENKKYEIILPPEKDLIGEKLIKFYFPESLESFKVTFQSFVKCALEEKIVDKKALREEVERILNEILGD